MILSFHPIVEADKNRLCAGRLPDEDDLAAIRRAEAVILPQGCSEALYRMARDNCPAVFPNLDVRFDYPGKCGQIRLFRELQVAHPASQLYASMADYHTRPPALPLPLVVKLDWGGQGETVFKAADAQDMDLALQRVAACEATGQSSFLVQQWIPDGRRSLRVTVIGRRRIVYWRIQPDPQRFGASLAAGGHIDPDADPDLQAAAQTVVDDFCRRSGLQLAGFDMLFDARQLAQGLMEPLMLEINYFFGRAGLGGSEGYYRILEEEVAAWLGERCKPF
ncbi:MAG: glutathione synthase [Desulfobacterales bacterium]|nr:glutathione synthase [Desulfobacterales bacterium]